MSNDSKEVKCIRCEALVIFEDNLQICTSCTDKDPVIITLDVPCSKCYCHVKQRQLVVRMTPIDPYPLTCKDCKETKDNESNS